MRQAADTAEDVVGTLRESAAIRMFTDVAGLGNVVRDTPAGASLREVV